MRAQGIKIFGAMYEFQKTMGFPCGSVVKNLPAVQNTRVPSLAQEDTLEKEMVVYFSILAWEISGIEEPGWQWSMGSQKIQT